MTYKTITTKQFLDDAAAWDIKRRARRRAAFFESLFNTVMGIFSLAFLALMFTIFAGPGLLAVAAFFGVPMP